VQRHLTQDDWNRMEDEHFKGRRMPLATTLFLIPWVCDEVPAHIRRRAFDEADGRSPWRTHVAGRRGEVLHERREQRTRLRRRLLDAPGVDRLGGQLQHVARALRAEHRRRAARCGSSTRRRPATYACSVPVTLGGGRSPHTRSTSASVGTTWPRCSVSAASSAACFGPPWSTSCPSAHDRERPEHLQLHGRSMAPRAAPRPPLRR
jgi:hypothetical protein